MNCANHLDRIASGTCSDCNKALCIECLDRFNIPICENCLLLYNSKIARKFYLDIISTILIFAGAFALIAYNTKTKLGIQLTAGLVFACAYWGWLFLGRLNTTILFTSGASFIMFLALKFAISVCIGIIIMPWQIFIRIKELYAINTLKKLIAEGKA